MSLTPPEIEEALYDIAERLEQGQRYVADLDKAYTEASMTYDLAHARALLRAEGSNADARKAAALLAVEDTYRAKEVAYLALRTARSRMEVLRVKADLLRSIGASVRTSMNLA